MTNSETVLSIASPAAQQLYRQLLASLRPIGHFEEEMKKTSVHLVRRTAFAGVHFRRDYLIITIKSEKPIASKRVAKTEQVSKNRWHNDVPLAAGAELDAEFTGWLREAYELCL